MILPFLFSTIFFVAFLLTFQLFRITQLVVNKGVDWKIVLVLIGHISISFLPISVPVSVLFATIYTLGKMSEDSEIIAMRSFGLGFQKLFHPFLLFGIMVGMVFYFLGADIIPYSRKEFKNTVVKLTSKGVLSNIKKEQFYTEIPDVILFAEDVLNDGKELRNVFIQAKVGEVERVIMAQKGLLIRKEVPGEVITGLHLHLYDGNLLIQDNSKNEIRKIIYKEYDFPIFNNQFRPDSVDRESTRTSKELLHNLKEDKIKYQKAKLQWEKEKKEEDKSDMEMFRGSITRAELEFWSRVSAPFQCVAFVFLAFSFGIKRPRGRSKSTIVPVLLILSLYYIFYFTGTSFTRKDQIPAFITAFFPILICTSIATAFYRKLNWQ